MRVPRQHKPHCSSLVRVEEASAADQAAGYVHDRMFSLPGFDGFIFNLVIRGLFDSPETDPSHMKWQVWDDARHTLSGHATSHEAVKEARSLIDQGNTGRCNH